MAPPARRRVLLHKQPGRILLALAAAGLGYVSAVAALGSAIARTDPDRALRIAPSNGRTQGLVALRLATDPAATPADRARADRLARSAVSLEPTAVAAVVTLGIDAAARGDLAAARRRLALSERLSRRDLTTQLWLIEDAVGRGDIPVALRHYDAALRTTPRAWDTLFPVLNAAAGEAPIRQGLVPLLAKRPIWADEFLTFASLQQTNPRATAALLRATTRAGGRVSGEAHARALGMLLDIERGNEAWSYYVQLHPGVDRRRSRDPDFKTAGDAPTPFDWVPVTDGAASSAVAGGVFDFALPPSVGGPLLRQYQLLPPGRYRLSGHVTGIDQPASSRPYWTLACRGGAELGRVDVAGTASFAAQIVVPAGCPIQILSFVARPSEAIGGLSGQVDRASIEPAS